MRPIDADRLERLFVEVRVEKEKMERLISDLELQAGMDVQDLSYLDGALQDVERGLRRIRDKCRPAGPLARIF